MNINIPTEEASKYVYKFEKRSGTEKPKNNAAHITNATKHDPTFLWHNSKEETSSGKTIWQRATQRRISPEYKKFLSDEKAARKAQLNSLSGLLGSMSMATTGTNIKNNFTRALITGVPTHIRKQQLDSRQQQIEQQAAQLKAEIDEIDKLLSGLKVGGKRHTKKRSHMKRRKTHRRR